MRTYVLPPISRIARICNAECRKLLSEHFDPIWNETDLNYTEEQLLELISDAEVIITGMGSMQLTGSILSNAPKLKYIGHAGGSIKKIIPQQAFSQGVKVFSANPRLAQSVGEYCMAVLMTLLRRLPQLDSGVRAGNWNRIKQEQRGHDLTGNTIGIVSAGETARAFLRFLAPFHVKVLLYDPYLSREVADQLGASLVSLEEVMLCPIISLHAPAIPETNQLITAELIRSIPDGAILINSARGTIIDEVALIEELQTGRFYAALDVYHREPLSEDSPLMLLDNVLLTPHIGGNTVEGHGALMFEVVEDIIRSRDNKATKYEVNEKMWKVMA